MKPQMKCIMLPTFNQGLHCLLNIKQPSGTEIHHNLENYTHHPLRFRMGSTIFIVSICMGKTTRIQRVNPFHFDEFFHACCKNKHGIAHFVF